MPVVIAAGVTILGSLLYFGGREEEAEGTGGVSSAPSFTLPSTAGGSVSLSDFAGRNVLLYFNEGVGCDACFYQMGELEQNASRFEEVGIEIVPIVANPAPLVSQELTRFGLTTPYLIDADTSVSAGYGMLGNGMHANLPGHGFVLVDGTGQIRWSREYASMFVSAQDLLAALPTLP